MVGFAEAERQCKHDLLADPPDDRIGEPVGIVEMDGSAFRCALLYPVPARIGPEALAIFRGQLFQRLPDINDTARARIMHRPAAERRKSGRENHGTVDRILVGHHALAQAGDADVEHRQNETIGHIGAGRRRAGILHGLAVLPV